MADFFFRSIFGFVAVLLFFVGSQSYSSQGNVELVKEGSLCRLLLDSQTLPIVDLFLAPDSEYLPYDNAMKTYDWPSLVGRSFVAHYHGDGKPTLEAPQNVLSPEQLEAIYPAISSIVKNMVTKHNQILASFRTNWKWRIASTLLTAVGKGTSVNNVNRSAPGELGQAAVQLEDQFASENLTSGLVQEEGMQVNAAERLHQVVLNKSYQALEEQLPQMVANTIASTGKFDSLEGILYLVHTHPGGVLPLSPNDLDYQRKVTRTLAGIFPYIRWRVVVIALAQRQTMGDIIFVHESTTEPSQRLSELLREIRK